MKEITKNSIETGSLSEPQPETVLTKFERKKALIERLRGEFKELYETNSPNVYDMDNWRNRSKESQSEYSDVDIYITVRKGEQIEEIRGYLSSQNDFKLIHEGKGGGLGADNYITFHIKLSEGEKPRMSLNKLKVLMNYFDEIGLYGSKYMRNEEKVRKSLLDGSTVPLTLAGRNGIRLIYDKETDKLQVTFVEGFSDPTFPLRKRVEAWLKENF